MQALAAPTLFSSSEGSRKRYSRSLSSRYSSCSLQRQAVSWGGLAGRQGGNPGGHPGDGGARQRAGAGEAQSPTAAPDGQQALPLPVGSIEIPVQGSGERVRVLNRLPQARLQLAGALQRRDHAQGVNILLLIVAGAAGSHGGLHRLPSERDGCGVKPERRLGMLGAMIENRQGHAYGDENAGAAPNASARAPSSAGVLKRPAHDSKRASADTCIDRISCDHTQQDCKLAAQSRQHATGRQPPVLASFPCCCCGWLGELRCTNLKVFDHSTRMRCAARQHPATPFSPGVNGALLS